MSEPYCYSDFNMLSECCEAPATGEIIDGLGVCSKCKEWSDFYIVDAITDLRDYNQMDDE